MNKTLYTRDSIEELESNIENIQDEIVGNVCDAMRKWFYNKMEDQHFRETEGIYGQCYFCPLNPKHEQICLYGHLTRITEQIIDELKKI